MKKYMEEFLSAFDLNKFLKKRVKRITLMENGCVKKVSYYDKYSKETSVKTYDQLINGNMVEDTYSIKNKYNKMGQLIEEKEFRNGELTYIFKYKYDKEWKLKESCGKEIRYGEENKTIYKYDSFGNRIYKRKTSIEDQEENYKEHTEYYYGKNRTERGKDKILRVKRYEEGPEGDRLVYEMENNYDEQGSLTDSFKQASMYYGSLNFREEEKKIEDEEEKSSLLKNLRTELKAFLEKGTEYRDDDILVRKSEKIYAVFYDDIFDNLGVSIELNKEIKVLEAHKLGSWDRKSFTRKVGYVKEEGYLLSRKIEGGGVEEIVIAEAYEYDIAKEVKLKYIKKSISKNIVNGEGSDICYYESTNRKDGNIDYWIVRKEYEGVKLMKESGEKRLYDVKSKKMGRASDGYVNRSRYNIKGQKIKEERYDIVGNSEELVEEKIYNEEGDLVESSTYEKGEIKQQLSMKEALNKKTGGKLVLVRGYLTIAAEEDEDGDPQTVIKIGEEGTQIKQFEYYEKQG